MEQDLHLSVKARLREAMACADHATVRAELERLLAGEPSAASFDQWQAHALVALQLDDLELAARLYAVALRSDQRHSLQDADFCQACSEWLYLRVLMQDDTAQLVSIYQDLKEKGAGCPGDDHVQALDAWTGAALSFRQGERSSAAFAAAEAWAYLNDQTLSHDLLLEALRPYTYLLLAQIWESLQDMAMAVWVVRQLLECSQVPKSLWKTLGVYACLLNQGTAWYERIGIHSDWEFTGRQTLELELLEHIVRGWSKELRIEDDALHQSLHLTLDGLSGCQPDREPLRQAVQVRPTNLLAAHHLLERDEAGDWRSFQGQWLISQPQVFGPLLSSRIHSPASRQDVDFAFVALNGGDCVGGSCYLVRINGKSLLLDVGLDVHTEPRLSYSRLKQKIEGAGLAEQISDIDTIVISHAHLDHVGLLPPLQQDLAQMRRKRQLGLVCYATPATRALAEVMLQDTARIMQATPSALYDADAATQAARALTEPHNGQLDLFAPGEGKIMLVPSGHILGSAMVLIERGGFRLLYTGDFCLGDQLTIPPAQDLSGLCPDVLIMESTYGYRTEPTCDRKVQEERFMDHLNATLRRGGIVLCPAFAVGRSQEVLGLVARHALQNPDLWYRIYVDGLSTTITRLYDQRRGELRPQYVELVQGIERRIRMVDEETDRLELLRTELQEGPAVVIASSGMLKQGSRSYFYARQLAREQRNAIFFTGYLPDDSDGWAFLQGRTPADKIALDCEVRRFSFTAHASKVDLIRFVLDVAPQVVILVHGNAGGGQNDPHTLYTCLQELSKIQVFVGRNHHPITQGNGRYVQL